MKDNSHTENDITNQWLKIWAQSSTLAWKNWLILMGLTPANSGSDAEESSKNIQNNHLSKPENEGSQDNIVVKSPESLKEIKLLKQQLSLKDSEITALNHKITISETEIAEKSKYYYCLEQEHRQQSQVVEQLQAKINQLELKILENQAETEDKKQQEHQINDLKDLAEKTKDYYNLQQEHKQQSQAIDELKAKIAQLENQLLIEPKNPDSDSSLVLAQIKSLHEELMIKEYQITQLTSKITATEQKIEENAKAYWLLQQENQQKTQTIEQLQTKIANLETVARIGERHLNKWRSRTF